MIREFFTGLSVLALIGSLPLTIILHSMDYITNLHGLPAIVAYIVLVIMEIVGIIFLVFWHIRSDDTKQLLAMLKTLEDGRVSS